MAEITRKARPGRQSLRILVNPKSGVHSLGRTLRTLKALFDRPHLRVDIHALKYPGHARKLAAEAAARGYWAVAVAGGDGTINEAVQSLAGRRTRLGILPLGTGNGLARGLGIPLSLKKAARIILAGRERRLDLGLINGRRYFANICGVGYDAWIARTANRLRGLGQVSGLGRYLAAGVLSLLQYRTRRLKIRAQGRRFESEILLLAVSNTTQYGLNAIIAPGADPGDRLLDLVVVPPLGPGSFLVNLFRLFSGQALARASYYRLTDVDVSVDGQPGPEVYFHADGEPAGRLPLSIRLSPRRLKVLAP